MRRDETLIRELMSHGADPNVKNKEGKTPLDYYRYQIRVDDFKPTLSCSEYQRLKKQGILTSGPAEMKEFNLVYWNDAAIQMAATTRNQKPLKMEMFTLTKKPEPEQLAVIATKQLSEDKEKPEKCAENKPKPPKLLSIPVMFLRVPDEEEQQHINEDNNYPGYQ